MNETYFDPNDVSSNKVIVIISLLFGILFFLPLVACPQSYYGRFYANQGLPLIGFIIAAVIELFAFVAWIIVFVGACTGKASRVPVIGEFELIK